MPSHSGSIRDLALATLGGLLVAASITFLALVAAPRLMQALDLVHLAPAIRALGLVVPIAALTAVAVAITQLATAAIFGLIHPDTPNPTTEGRERE